MHAIVPIDALRATPLPKAVAAIDLADAPSTSQDLPQGTTRYAVSINGTETEEQLLTLKVLIRNRIVFTKSFKKVHLGPLVIRNMFTCNERQAMPWVAM